MDGVASPLYVQRLLIVNEGTVPCLKSLRLHLQRVGIHLPLPEPLGTSKLHMLRIDPGDVVQILEKRHSVVAVVDTQSYVCYSVFHGHFDV